MPVRVYLYCTLLTLARSLTRTYVPTYVDECIDYSPHKIFTPNSKQNTFLRMSEIRRSSHFFNFFLTSRGVSVVLTFRKGVLFGFGLVDLGDLGGFVPREGVGVVVGDGRWEVGGGRGRKNEECMY